MSRARHNKEHERKRARGGVVAYAGGESNVMKEAKERKRGGRVHHEAEGEEAHERHDRHRRRGGHVEHHEHEKHRKRGGRVHHGKHRAKGGEVGANERPLSTAARVSHIKGVDSTVHTSD